RAGGGDERVGGRQRIDRGRAQLEERLGDQIPAGPDDVLTVQLTPGDRAAGPVDVAKNSHAHAPFVRVCSEGNVMSRRGGVKFPAEGSPAVRAIPLDEAPPRR